MYGSTIVPTVYGRCLSGTPRAAVPVIKQGSGPNRPELAGMYGGTNSVRQVTAVGGTTVYDRYNPRIDGVRGITHGLTVYGGVRTVYGR